MKNKSYIIALYYKIIVLGLGINQLTYLMMTKGTQPSKTVTKSFRMDTGLVAEIQKIAEKENRKFSNVVTTILMKELNYGKGKSASI